MNIHAVVNFKSFFKPRKIEIVSSTVGSLTNTFWKRRSKALSFPYIGDIHQALWHRLNAIHHVLASVLINFRRPYCLLFYQLRRYYEFHQ